MLAGRSGLRPRGAIPHAGAGVLRPVIDDWMTRIVTRTALYSFLSNPRHNTGHPVIWIEWLLSTLFDASLLTPEPPFGGSFFAPARGGTTRAWCPGRRPARSLHSARFEGDFLTLACECGLR